MPLLSPLFLLVMDLLPPHQRLFEGWEELHSDGLLPREQPHNLLCVQHGRAELEHVLAALGSPVLVHFALQILWQEHDCSIRVYLLIQKALFLFFH